MQSAKTFQPSYLCHVNSSFASNKFYQKCGKVKGCTSLVVISIRKKKNYRSSSSPQCSNILVGSDNVVMMDFMEKSLKYENVSSHTLSR